MGALPVTMTFVLAEDGSVSGGMSSDMFAAELEGRFDADSSTLEIAMNMEQGQGPELTFQITGDRIEGTNEIMGGQTAKMTGSKVGSLASDTDGEPAPARKTGRLRNIKLGSHALGFAGDGGMFGLEGDVVGTGVVIEERVVGSLQTMDGRYVPFELVPRVAEDQDPESDEEKSEGDDEEVESADAPTILASLPVPIGVYGRLEPAKARTVLDPGGRHLDVRRRGRSSRPPTCSSGTVGSWRSVANSKAAADAMVIEAAGMHLSPGLIDCHSHAGISGGVNEGGQTNTAARSGSPT